jgi:hypothetical protein
MEAPDDETATMATLALSSRDNVSTQTLRSFTATEMANFADPETALMPSLVSWERSGMPECTATSNNSWSVGRWRNQ